MNVFGKTAVFILCIGTVILLPGCFESPNDSSRGMPVITHEPEDAAAVFGDTIVFKVSVEGDTPFTYQWYKYDTEIDGATGSALVLPNILPGDSGYYRVTIHNEKGEVVSDRANLRVSGGEPVIGQYSRSGTVGVNGTMSLSAEVVGNKPFTFRWLKDDTLIPEADDSVYTIDNVSLHDSGHYRMVVSNDIASDTSDEMIITVDPGKLFVMQTDWEAGRIEWLALGENRSSDDNLSIYSDAVLRSFGGYLYILERQGADNVVKFDPAKKDKSGVLYQVHLGDNWNPQDIEFASDTKAYIANQNEPEVTIFNPATGVVTGHIKIDQFTFMPDSNSSPYANQMALVGKKLYVALQRRNGFSPGAPTLIISIDTDDDKVIEGDTIVCAYANNYDMIAVDNALYCTNQGSVFSTGDGGIEKVNCTTNEVSTILTEEALGGNPNQIVHKSGSRFYVQNYIGWKEVTVVEIDTDEGSVVATLDDVRDGYGGICYDPAAEKLYVGERDSTGVGVIGFKENKKVEGPYKSSNSLPPTGMVIVR